MDALKATFKRASSVAFFGGADPRGNEKAGVTRLSLSRSRSVGAQGLVSLISLASDTGDLRNYVFHGPMGTRPTRCNRLDYVRYVGICFQNSRKQLLKMTGVKLLIAKVNLRKTLTISFDLEAHLPRYIHDPGYKLLTVHFLAPRHWDDIEKVYEVFSANTSSGHVTFLAAVRLRAEQYAKPNVRLRGGPC